MNITPGLCQCGCGQSTSIITKTRVARRQVKGTPRKFIHGHNRKKESVVYRQALTSRGTQRRIHTLRAEKALGKPLAPMAVVHHADGSKNEWAPLVICQDQSYHMLLHSLMKVKAAGGRPFIDRLCGRCRRCYSVAEFGPSDVCLQCFGERKALYQAKLPHEERTCRYCGRKFVSVRNAVLCSQACVPRYAAACRMATRASNETPGWAVK